MPTLSIKFAPGVNTDLPANTLQPGQTTTATGVEYRDSTYSTVRPFVNQIEIPGGPYGHIAVQRGGLFYFLGTSQAHSWNASALTDVSNTNGYSNIQASNAHQWTADVSSTIVFANHPSDYPQYIGPGLARFTDLPFGLDDDNAVETWRGKQFRTNCLRAHKNYLFALGMSEAGNDLPNVLRWSDTFDEGGFPSTWDETDPTNQAGRILIPEGQGSLIDGRTAGNNFLLFKDQGITHVVFIGGVFIWRFRPITEIEGVLSNNCIAEVDSNLFVFGQDDIYTISSNGQIQSIANNRVRRKVFNDLEPSKHNESFVVLHHDQSEVLFCYPVPGGVFEAAVFNYDENAWTFRELETANTLTAGIVNTSAITWDNADYSWAGSNEPWAGSESALIRDTLVGVRGSHIVTEGAINGQAGLIEQLSMPINEDRDLIQVSSCVPRVEAPSGARFTVQFGSQRRLSEQVYWKPPQEFTVGETSRLPVRATGQYISYRITIPEGTPMRINGLELTYSVAGKR